jgi:ABC-type nitrate/sulfonate/bicarbonate transport system substrate-binding protein
MDLPAYKTALVTYPHTQALKDGAVSPRTFTFDFEDVPVIIKAFRRMVRGLEFDISEMAITTYLTAKAHGKRFTAIPVFPMRAFHHGAILYNTTSGIRTPKDLEGKKVGVNRGYTVTTGLWARSILQHEYGVDLKKITWVLSGDEHVAEYRPPSNVVPIAEGRTLEEMLLSGELAAANGVQVDAPEIKPLIPNAKEAGLAGLRQGGLYPINHTVVVKDDLLAAHPDLAADLFEAFVRAKRVYVDRLKSGAIAEPTAADKTFVGVMAITGDPLPYGVAPNRREIEAVIQYSVEQGILTKPFAVEDVFAKGTLDLVG